MAAETEASLLSEKCKKFGLLGAGLIPDPMMTLRLAEVQQNSPIPEVKEAPKPAAEAAATSAPTATGPPQALAPSTAAAASSSKAPVVKGPESVEVNGHTITREKLLEVVAELCKTQGIIQQHVCTMARKISKEAKKTKKKVKMSFMEAYKKVEEQDWPKDPLEQYGLTESSLQQVLSQYEQDEEVMEGAQKLLHPEAKGDAARVAGITVTKVVDIHKFMVTEMNNIVREFRAISGEERRKLKSKACEYAAELLVSVAVEQNLGVRCEDVEQAVIKWEEQLSQSAEFAQFTEQLANMMQHLIAATNPLPMDKEQFLKLLQTLGGCTQKAKTFTKSLLEEYRSKTSTIDQCYQKFTDFLEESNKSAGEAEGFPEVGQVEMLVLFDEFGSDPEVKKLWEESGCGFPGGTGPMGGAGGGFAGALPGPAGAAAGGMGRGLPALGNGGMGATNSEEQKVVVSKNKKPLKAAEVVDMQEYLVDEMRRICEALAASAKPGKPMSGEVAMQMVQAFAIGAVEKKFNITPNDFVAASMTHAAAAQRSERLMRASERQHEAMMQLARACGEGGLDAE